MKLWLNLQVPSWTEKNLFLGNSGFDGDLVVNFTMDANIFGRYTDPYLKSINATNPYLMNFSENNTIIEADDKESMRKVTYQVKFSRQGSFLGYNNISVREGQAKVSVKKDDYERMVKKMEEMEEQMKNMKKDGNYSGNFTDKDQIKLHKAEQSSTEVRFGCQGNNTCGAAMATDGNMATGSVTKYTSFSWWMAEMEKLAHVDAVMVYTDPWAVQQGYFRRFKVETKMREHDEWTMCKDEHSVTAHDPHVVQCDQPTTARYIRVSVTPSGSCVPLYLHEVKVMGRPSVARPGGPKMVRFPSINKMEQHEMVKLQHTDADAYVKTVGFSQVAGKEMHAGVMLVNPGPALDYVHSYETMMLVLNGTFQLHHHNMTYNITRGQSMYMPRGARVSYKAMGDRPARLYFVMQPPSFERAEPIQMAMEKNPRIKVENTTDSLYDHIELYKNEFNSSSYLRDMLVSKVNGSGMTGGLYKLLDGPALDYTYEYEEFKYIVSGQFDLTDGTGQQVTAKAGDLIYFPKNTFVHFTSPDYALGFYVGQRAEGTA
jgi:ethanolamine utilization protein EutQ (cupin superfamily)